MKPALFTVEYETREPLSKCRDLIPLKRDACLSCGAPTRMESAGQLALFRHGGYGATRMTTFAVCPNRDCLAVRFVRTIEVRPELNQEEPCSGYSSESRS